MADLIAKMRIRTKAAGLVALFGLVFMVSMAIKEGNAPSGLLGAGWTAGTFIVAGVFREFLLEDLKKASKPEADRG